MSNRERSLAAVLAGFLVLIGIGFVAYQFVFSPLAAKNKQIDGLNEDIRQRNLDLDEIQTAKRKFETTRQMSLGNAGVSRGPYAELLKSLLVNAGFPVTALKISLKEPDSKTAPAIQGKKTAYTRLVYDISAKGELFYFVEFLKRFYEQPLLHAVKSINILRPSDAKAQARGELDVTMTIEALVLENATEQSPPVRTPTELAAVSIAGGLGAKGLSAKVFVAGKPLPGAEVVALATPARDYQSISTKNVFFGPAPPEKTKMVVERDVPAEDDISNFITLTSVVGHPEDGKIEAVFRDKLNNHEYTVIQTASGKITVDATYDLKGRKKAIYKAGGQEIIYGSDEGQNRRAFRVRRVNPGEVVLEEIYVEKAKEKPTFTLLTAGGLWSAVSLTDKPCSTVSVGQTLEGMSQLTSREAFKAIYAKPAFSEVSAEDKGR